jgi:hypothetical protein
MFIIELAKGVYSTVLTLPESKRNDTYRTLVLEYATTYRSEVKAETHCANIKKGKFKNATVRKIKISFDE